MLVNIINDSSDSPDNGISREVLLGKVQRYKRELQAVMK